MSFLKGVVAGGVVASIPMLLTNADLGNATADPRAIAVGASVGVAGIIGAIIGRPVVPIEENVAHNESLRTEWQQQQAAIAERNARTLRFAPLRIRVRDRE